jgi:hypothetical protein
MLLLQSLDVFQEKTPGQLCTTSIGRCIKLEDKYIMVGVDTTAFTGHRIILTEQLT